MTRIEIEGLHVERHGRTVLDIPSLRIRARRTTAVLGPNGAGKTTLLRAIAGLETLAQGTLRLRDESEAGSVNGAINVAYAFQEQVFLRGSVRENLELGLRLRSVDAPTRRARVAEAAALLDVAHLLDRRADRLSGGEARRVSLARALCLHAPLVLLDEPLAGLDGRTYLRLLDEMPQLLRAFAATTILVTHDREEALRLADDLVVLIDGQVRAHGDKHPVATHPRLAAVAELLGYTVLEIGGRRLAVPPGAIAIGEGPAGFDVVVEDVLDLVDHCEIAGRVGTVRVRIPLKDETVRPQRGSLLRVHAGRIQPIE
jgi:ABC-type sugar transport system ATPase subunit